MSDEKQRGDLTILGGGGLLGSWCGSAVEMLSRSGLPLVAWGVGHNEPIGSEWKPEFLRRFNLVGMRDWNSPFDWVPCSSCMSRLFDKRYEVIRPVGLYESAETCAKKISIEGIPKLTNYVSTMSEAISFLGSSEVILTNSYHGAYWGTLLGRKVVIVSPSSSKLFRFRHQPEIALNGEWMAAAKLTQGFPEALQECRASNQRFFGKILELL